jgi:hypothetical protein
MESREVVSQGFENRWRILKASGTTVDTGVFLDEAYGVISGVLFAGAHPLRVKGLHPDGLAYLHNPKAVAPLPRRWLRAGIEYWVEDNCLMGACVSTSA